MRAPFLAGLALLASGPAFAQGLSLPSTDGFNAQLAHQGEIRALQQNQISDINTLRMQNQRAVQFQPQPTFVGPTILRRGAGFNPAGPNHSGVRVGRTRTDRSLDTGICVGC